jgi:hypothetical protein
VSGLTVSNRYVFAAVIARIKPTHTPNVDVCVYEMYQKGEKIVPEKHLSKKITLFFSRYFQNITLIAAIPVQARYDQGEYY